MRKADYTKEEGGEIHHTWRPRNGDGSQGELEHTRHPISAHCEGCGPRQPHQKDTVSISGHIIKG